MIKKAGNLFATAYLILIFAIYPFYMADGYVDIGEAKYKFFVFCSLGGLVILAALALAEGFQTIWQRYRCREAYLIRWERISVTDLFVVLYAIEVLISFLLSDYKQEALQGTEGWRIGLVLLVMLCVFYFLISRQWKGAPFLWYVCMAASGIVFILGILDRFSIYLIPIEIRDPGFISTLGNINWFCGYLSVLMPIGACIFIHGERRREKWALGLYLLIGFMAGFCQGSSSVFLLFGALFFLLLWTAVSKREKLAGWLLMTAIWGAAGQVVRVLRIIMPDNYNYDTNNLCGMLTGSNLLLAVAVICLFIGVILKCRGTGRWCNEGEIKRIHQWMMIIPVTVFLLWGVITLLNTWKGIPGLKNSSVFLFDENWGNGRGATWKAGIEVFGEMPIIGKLFGVGPDCFCAYAYAQPKTAEMLRAYFGSIRLTNAHNELLTGLVNTGIFGVLLYLGIFLSSILRCLKRAEGEPYLFIPAVCAFCYLVHNAVSFAQVLNLPFIFLIMAMGEGLLRRYQS